MVGWRSARLRTCGTVVDPRRQRAVAPRRECRVHHGELLQAVPRRRSVLPVTTLDPMAKRGSGDEQPLIRSQVAAAVALSANAVVAAYFGFQAWAGPAEWRPESIVAATGLALLTGTVAWARFGKRS